MAARRLPAHGLARGFDSRVNFDARGDHEGLEVLTSFSVLLVTLLNQRIQILRTLLPKLLLRIRPVRRTILKVLLVLLGGALRYSGVARLLLHLSVFFDVDDVPAEVVEHRWQVTRLVILFKNCIPYLNIC